MESRKGTMVDLTLNGVSNMPKVKAVVGFLKKEDIPENLSEYTVKHIEVPVNDEEYILEPTLVKKTGNESVDFIIQPAILVDIDS